MPFQTFKLLIISFFSATLILSNLLNPQVSIFADSLDLEFLVSNPLATALILLSPIFIDDAKEYFSTVRNPVFIPSAPIFLYNRGFLFP